MFTDTWYSNGMYHVFFDANDPDLCVATKKLHERSAKRPCSRLSVGIFYLVQISNLVDQLLGFLPAQTRVGDRFTVAAFADLLVAILDVAFDHQAADKAVEIRIVMDTVQYLFADTDLFHKLLA